MKNYFIIAIVLILTTTVNKSFAQRNRFYTLKECNYDTLFYLNQNFEYNNITRKVPMSKVLEASKSLPFKSIIIHTLGDGSLQIFLFYLDTKQIKEYINQNKEVNFVVCMFEPELSPSYNVEKYQEIKKFGLRLLQKISPKLKKAIQDCQIGYTRISYYTPELFYSDVKIKEE